jgi:hypothetical protein
MKPTRPNRCFDKLGETDQKLNSRAFLGGIGLSSLAPSFLGGQPPRPPVARYARTVVCPVVWRMARQKVHDAISALLVTVT